MSGSLSILQMLSLSNDARPCFSVMAITAAGQQSVIDGLHAKEICPCLRDQELHESTQAFRAIGAAIELQPILAFLAATRARTVPDQLRPAQAEPVQTA